MIKININTIFGIYTATNARVRLNLFLKGAYLAPHCAVTIKVKNM